MEIEPKPSDIMRYGVAACFYGLRPSRGSALIRGAQVRMVLPQIRVYDLVVRSGVRGEPSIAVEGEVSEYGCRQPKWGSLSHSF